MIFRLNPTHFALLIAVTINIIAIISVESSKAAEKGISLQATFRDTSNALVNAAGVNVNVKILSSNNCVLRDENFSGQNITNGYLSLNITNGSVASGGGYYDPGLSVAQVFDNSVVKSGLTCLTAGGAVNGAVTTYTPLSTDARKIRVSFLNGADTVVADFNMRSMPFATNADHLNGKADSNFLQVNAGAGTTQANVESIFNRFTKLDSILNNFNAAGTTLSANISGSAASATTATTAVNVTGTVAIANGGTGATNAAAAITALLPAQTGNSGKYLTTDGTTASWATVSGGGGSGTVTSVTSANSDIGVATGTTTPVLTLNSGTSGGAGDANKIAKLDASGLLSTAMIPNLAASKITSGQVGVANGGTGLASGTSGGIPYFSGSTTMASSAALTANGVMIGGGAGAAPTATSAPTGSGQVLRWNGSAWSPNFISMFDLRSTVTGSVTFGSGSTGCTSNQTLTWTSATDNLSCTNISLPVGQITGNLPLTQVTGTLSATNGGTGQSSFGVGDILYASTTSALSRLPASTSGYVLTSNGAGTAPSWQAASGGTWSENAASSLVAGTSALSNNSNASTYNVAIGFNAQMNMKPASGAANNIGIGNGALRGSGTVASNTGTENIGMGSSALFQNSSGTGNIGIGTNAMFNTSTGGTNVGIGYSALFENTIGGSNVAVGYQSGRSIASGSNNSNFGYASGYVTTNNMSGSNNTFLGASARYTDSATVAAYSYMTAVGAGAVVGTANTVVLGRTTDKVVIGATDENGSASLLQVTGGGYYSGSVGIGALSPVAKLEVSGGSIVGTANSNAGSSIDFGTGNLQYTSASCGAMTLNNMKSGASYTLAVQGSSGGSCAFTLYSGNGTGALTLKAGSVSLTQTAGKHTLFTFIVMGTTAYVASIDNY